jgi:hypothetical protein
MPRATDQHFKKSYETPKIFVFGDIRELTKQNGPAQTSGDNGTSMNNNKTG